jgi:hypothetical protein
MKRRRKMKEKKFKSLITCVHVFLNTFYPVCPVILSKNKTIGNLSSLITCVPVFLSTCPFLYRFGTCLISVWYRFVSISIGIFTYVFLPQTSFLTQKRRKAPFSDFLNFVFSHLPGVPDSQTAKLQGLNAICRLLAPKDPCFGGQKAGNDGKYEKILANSLSAAKIERFQCR